MSCQISMGKVGSSAAGYSANEDSSTGTFFDSLDSVITARTGTASFSGLTGTFEAENMLQQFCKSRKEWVAYFAGDHAAVSDDWKPTTLAIMKNMSGIFAPNKIESRIPIAYFQSFAHFQSKNDEGSRIVVCIVIQ